ncbi:MAG: flagellar hook-basal body complex protein, partial [Alphaproteobacteria bacterium]|nr:flagellar hook-basal body complex protein [Alphaproteobacteria bacterium]
MSLYGALFSGVSGISAQSQSMGIIADNITNVNTIGYKTSRADFSTLVTASGTASKYSPGGVSTNPGGLVDRQGLLQASTSPTDLAITGKGFFVVNTDQVPTTTSPAANRSRNEGSDSLISHRQLSGSPRSLGTCSSVKPRLRNHF